MRGSGGAFGFQAITDIGAELQQAAESADTEASRKWVGELSRYLDRVEGTSNIDDLVVDSTVAAARRSFSLLM
jgi:HPt (histidine-containing phosphotransfer) domain-containing protein